MKCILNNIERLRDGSRPHSSSVSARVTLRNPLVNDSRSAVVTCELSGTSNVVVAPDTHG